MSLFAPGIGIKHAIMDSMFVVIDSGGRHDVTNHVISVATKPPSLFGGKLARFEHVFRARKRLPSRRITPLQGQNFISWVGQVSVQTAV